MDTVKILVVDDEDRMRKLVRDYLSREGYIILEAADGEEAVRVFFDNRDIHRSTRHDNGHESLVCLCQRFSQFVLS